MLMSNSTSRCLDSVFEEGAISIFFLNELIAVWLGASRTRVTAKVREGRRSQQCEPMKAYPQYSFPSLVTHEFGWINGERSQRGNRGRGDAQERHRYHG